MIRSHPEPKGLVIVHTGDGKGKSTAALGMILRALGHGMRAVVLQFFKGARPSGELILNSMTTAVQICPLGEGFTWEVGPERSRFLAEKAWKRCEAAMASGDYDMVVCDEINVALDKGFLAVETVLEALRDRPTHVHVVLTGRGAPAELCDLADLVTEMRMIKHPYAAGIKAQPGIEF